MALTFVALDMLTRVAKNVGQGARIVCLGYPDMLVTEEQLVSFCGADILTKVEFREDAESILRWHRLEGQMTRIVETKSLFSAMGLESDFLDITASRGFEKVVDLNHPVPSDLLGKYDIVYDGGTMEHCFNVGQVMRNIIGMVKTGGIIIHINPLNFFNHGFINFNPTFYHDFYTQSGNKIVSDFLCIHGPVLQPQVLKLPAIEKFKAIPERSVLFVMAQKLSDAEPKWPTQSKYLYNAELKG